MNRATTERRRGTSARWRAALPLALLLAACSQARPDHLGAARCDDSYAQGVGPLLVAECGACHSATLAEGDYRVDSYQAAIGRRPDGTIRVRAGDSSSPLLLAAQGVLPGGHVAITKGQIAELETWVVQCALKPKPYTHHINGWMDPGNTDQFHGLVLRQAVYNLTGCQGCHGADLSGGTANVSCQSCHSSGVMACNTCHGNATNAAPPRDLDYNSATSLVTVGAHQSHVTNGPLHTGYACQVCHTTPSQPGDEGHYQVGGKLLQRPAPVLVRSAPTGAFSWDRANATCTNGYCHAPFQDSNASPINPVWTAVGQNQAPCGSCHGNPPAGHSPDPRCWTCHRPDYVGPDYVGTQPNTPFHANGQVDLAAPPGSCVGCHGSGDSPAPPVDLLGRTDESLQTVGAHREHVSALHKVSAPVACNECHLVPTELHSPGHIDTPPPAKVFPPGAGVLAVADGASATYDQSTATCTAYCHGSGALLSQDTSTSINHTPVWNGGPDQAACGSCHGIPPRIPGTLYHVGVTNITQCANCHPNSVTSAGNIIVDASGHSTHVDGVVEALPFP
jgi:predicted CxxxxCH...CXXCH cytochrome family protein